MTEPALAVHGVSKTYGDFNAVSDLTLEVPHGTIYGFLGPNGAGKTTTIRMVLDIIKPTKGTIRILGQPSAMLVRDQIGYLPEEKGLYKKMRAWSIVAYFAALKGVPRKEAKTRAYELLERYGLKDFADAKVEALSKGMGQKVQVLASIAHRPRFVILDEPFSGLDPANQQVMEEVIRDIAADGRTVIFSTHVMSHAERICNRIVLIAKGRNVFDGTIPEARRCLPNRVRLRAAVSPNQLAALPHVAKVAQLDGQQPGLPQFELDLEHGGSHQMILKACFDRDIRLEAFDHDEPTLHDVFIHLVGAEAKEASHR
jgi:ABC-2 type transport system ATP-binding protein